MASWRSQLRDRAVPLAGTALGVGSLAALYWAQALVGRGAVRVVIVLLLAGACWSLWAVYQRLRSSGLRPPSRRDLAAMEERERSRSVIREEVSRREREIEVLKGRLPPGPDA